MDALPRLLRQKRQLQKKTYAEASIVLNVTVEALEIMESQPYQAWPWPEYMRVGLLTSYATWLGLDPIRCLRYRSSFRIPNLNAEAHALHPWEYACIVVIGLIGLLGLWLFR